MNINSTLEELFDGELQASAAGYPGAQNDSTTYTQIDLVLESNDPSYQDEMINILLRKNQLYRCIYGKK